MPSDRRHKPRLPADQTVQVTLLGPNDICMVGHVVDVSGTGVRLLVGCPVALGAAVQIDLGSSVLSGEVQYCRPEGDDFALGLQFDSSIRDLKSLIGMLG